MKFSVAVTTLLPLFVAFPPNISARLASRNGHDHDNGDATMDSNNDEKSQADVRYLTWNNNSNKDTSLDESCRCRSRGRSWPDLQHTKHSAEPIL